MVLLVSVLLLSALGGAEFGGKVSAAGPYDWPMHRHDLQHTGYSASPAPITNQTLWNYTAGNYVGAGPTVADGKLYATTGQVASYTGGIGESERVGAVERSDHQRVGAVLVAEPGAPESGQEPDY